MFDRKKRILVGFITFLFILTIFIAAARLEHSRVIEVQKRSLRDNVSILQAQIDNLLNQRIRHVVGIIAYIQTRPDITASEFEAFSNKVIDKDDSIIRNVTCIKDTTIAFVYPVKGNEAAIGIDLATIEGQSETILHVKESRSVMLTGPVNLVQGGRGLISRMPVILNPNSADSTYWGQISLVVNFDELLEQSGINAIQEDYNIKIEQLNPTDEIDHIIFSNHDDFLSEGIKTTLYLPNAQWQISIEYPEGYNGRSSIFYILLCAGFIFGILTASYMVLILHSHSKLDILVQERTKELEVTDKALNQINSHLSETQNKLKDAQEQLILSEKLASLGEQVASISHEINTPLGLAITLATYIENKNNDLKNILATGDLTKSHLTKTIDETEESTQILVENLNRASDLVASFKMIATDQYLDDHRMINLKEYVHAVLKTLLPRLKNSTHTLDIQVDESINIMTYPGVLSQVIINLIMNSLVHGFKDIKNGRITIEAGQISNTDLIYIHYSDTGVGIAPEIADKIFTPFFTTNKDKGSSGLGMHIVLNAVEHILNGHIHFENIPTGGVMFKIEFPLSK